MGKVGTALFFVAMLIFLCYIHTNAARPEPAALYKESSAQIQPLADHGEAVDESCEGVGADECLKRRTLAAHLDYIYTHNHHP